MGSIIPPRERGRYSGYMAAVMAVATVSGPLLGGLLVDSVGWRWCFWAAVPISLVGLGMLQKFLHLERVRRQVKIDWWGAVLISIAASLPAHLGLLRRPTATTGSRSRPPTSSCPTAIAVVALVLVERSHPEPLIPGRILLERTTSLAIIGSIAVGIAQFGDLGLPQPVLPGRTGLLPHRGRPAHAPAHPRQHGRRDRLGPAHHPHRHLEALHARRVGAARSSASASWASPTTRPRSGTCRST